VPAQRPRAHRTKEGSAAITARDGAPRHRSPSLFAASIDALRGETGATRAELDRDDVLDRVRVLLVEDDADNREVLRRLLEQHRASVATAASAREALEMISTLRPSIIVSDIGLPEIDGYELIRRIRGADSEIGAQIPAIALTAHASADDRTRALRAGFQAHIPKPVEPLELVATIKSLAGFRSREGAASQA
jgi:CheY-like chemotaxis protein